MMQYNIVMQNTYGIDKLHKQFYQNVQFSEIQHIPETLISDDIRIEQKCLLINYRFFEIYPRLINILKHSLNNQERMCAAEIILSLNGQNDLAWNIKKQLLQNQIVNLDRQLKFNGCICLKFKKSSSYYEYRLRVIKKMAQSNQINCLQLLTHENQLLEKVLSRFFRNYFCWMYKLNLFNLLTNKQNQKEMTRIELEHIHSFLNKNFNDYSAFSYLINLVSKYQVDRERQIEWAQNNLQFCEIAYEKQTSYNNLIMYFKWLKS